MTRQSLNNSEANKNFSLIDADKKRKTIFDDQFPIFD